MAAGVGREMTNGHNSQHKQLVRLAGSSQRWLELERLAGGTVGGSLAVLATSPAGTVHPNRANVRSVVPVSSFVLIICVILEY